MHCPRWHTGLTISAMDVSPTQLEMENHLKILKYKFYGSSPRLKNANHIGCFIYRKVK